MAIVAAMLSVVSILLIWKPSIWLGLFTDETEILTVGGKYLQILAPSYPFLGMSMACSFTFQGLGRAVFPLVLVAVRTVIVVAAAIVLAALGTPV